MALKPSKPGVIITIAREHGSSGKQIGKLVAQKLGIPFYYKEMVALAAHESGLDREFISDIHKNAPDAMRDLYLSSQVVQRAIAAQDRIIRRIADNGSCVIVGRAADYVLREHKNVVRVFVHAPLDYRIRRVMEVYGDTLREAKRNIRHSDKARASYYRHISGRRWGDAENYELTVDSSAGLEETAAIIVAYARAAAAGGKVIFRLYPITDINYDAVSGFSGYGVILYAYAVIGSDVLREVVGGFGSAPRRGRPGRSRRCCRSPWRHAASRPRDTGSRRRGGRAR